MLCIPDAVIEIKIQTINFRFRISRESFTFKGKPESTWKAAVLFIFETCAPLDLVDGPADIAHDGLKIQQLVTTSSDASCVEILIRMTRATV